MRTRAPLAPPAPHTAGHDTPPKPLPEPKDYIDAVRRRDPGKAGGPCGTTFLHLRTLFSIDDSITQDLTAALNHINTNTLNPIARNIMNASRCVPIPKDKPNEIRPLAIGSVYLRLAQTAALTPLADQLREYFTPLQYGIGLKSGAELMTHAIRSHLELNPNHVVVKCDARNAFNAFNRDRIWCTVDKHFPSLSNLIRFSYGVPSELLYAEPQTRPTTIQSTVGSRQGCVLGSLTYCLALHPALQTLATEFPDVLILSYVDDTHILGTPARAAQAYRRWAQLYSAWMEGELRDDKGASFSYKASAADVKAAGLPPTMPHSNDGIGILGSATGTPAYTENFLNQKVQDVTNAIDVLGRADHHQSKFIIMQKSLAHKVTHLQRTLYTGSPTSNLANIGRKLDLRMRALLQSLTPHTFLNDTAWELATLPPLHGGLGIQTFQHNADPAFLASYTLASSTLPNLFPHLADAFGDPAASTPPHNTTPTAIAAREAYRSGERSLPPNQRSGSTVSSAHPGTNKPCTWHPTNEHQA